MSADDRWLVRFHRGDRSVLTASYVEHFDAVRTAVRRVLAGADGDTVVHNVFFRLVSDAKLRENYRGGSFTAWLSTVARNDALNFRRRRGRERELTEELSTEAAGGAEAELHAKLLVDRFRNERLPEKLRPLFEARFLRQLSQREAARELDMHRTTLVYQEQQIRTAMRAFFLEDT
jgi:RNA polymerase sigma-70 factor (ECF subfamily)